MSQHKKYLDELKNANADDFISALHEAVNSVFISTGPIAEAIESFKNARLSGPFYEISNCGKPIEGIYLEAEALQVARELKNERLHCGSNPFRVRTIYGRW